MRTGQTGETRVEVFLTRDPELEAPFLRAPIGLFWKYSSAQIVAPKYLYSSCSLARSPLFWPPSRCSSAELRPHIVSVEPLGWNHCKPAQWGARRTSLPRTVLGA